MAIGQKRAYRYKGMLTRTVVATQLIPTYVLRSLNQVERCRPIGTLTRSKRVRQNRLTKMGGTSDGWFLVAEWRDEVCFLDNAGYCFYVQICDM